MITLKKQKELSTYQLKCVALVTMTLDHFGKMFVGYWIAPLGAALHLSPFTVLLLVMLVLAAGRVSVYIFMWFIAEGCLYTRNKPAYIGRLLLFGLLSEIPFQLMVHIIIGTPLSLRFGLTNVMFTFALGALACCGYQLLADKKNWLAALRYILPAACAAAAYLLETDYGAYGVLCIFLLYIVNDHKKRLGVLTLLIVLFVGIYIPATTILTYGFNPALLIELSLNLAYSLLAVLLLSAYHGKRGKSGRMAKYFFYAYYPVHITALVLAFVLFM